MKIALRYSLIPIILLGLPPFLHAVPPVPANLEPPPSQTLALEVTGRGVQIYQCREVPNAAGKYEWSFKAPEADLFDAQGKKVGKHYAGPTWELSDGRKVVGRVKAKADAPDGKGIPWLLLDAAESKEPTIGQVRSIQRINTEGGKPPQTAADQTKVGHEERVPYTATYRFYTTRP